MLIGLSYYVIGSCHHLFVQLHYIYLAPGSLSLWGCSTFGLHFLPVPCFHILIYYTGCMQELEWSSHRLKAIFSVGGFLWLFCSAVVLSLPINMNVFMYILSVVIGIANAFMMVSCSSIILYLKFNIVVLVIFKLTHPRKCTQAPNRDVSICFVVNR